jgi:mannose-6-phosphate isomerase-like protein (cupin superfamily)
VQVEIDATFFYASDLEKIGVDTLQGFPRVVTELPEADIQFQGVKGWIAQGESHQIAFFKIEASAEVSEHRHDSPQWGIVVEGKMELTIGNETRIYEKGDEYFIPPHTKHSAKFLNKVRSIDFFGEKTRYNPKIKSF